MPRQTKICRVCGATYEACNSARSGVNAFNWREVACSPECGMVYLEKVTASRSVAEPISEPTTTYTFRKKKNKKQEELPAEVVVLPDESEERIAEDIEVAE